MDPRSEVEVGWWGLGRGSLTTCANAMLVPFVLTGPDVGHLTLVADEQEPQFLVEQVVVRGVDDPRARLSWVFPTRQIRSPGEGSILMSIRHAALVARRAHGFAQILG